jgi:hypothetical protein
MYAVRLLSLFAALALAPVTTYAKNLTAEMQAEWDQILAADLLAAEAETESVTTYHPDLADTGDEIGSGIQGSTQRRNIPYPATWEYYRFCATVDDLVLIEVHRTTRSGDLVAMVCQGVTDGYPNVDPTGISGRRLSQNCGTMGEYPNQGYNPPVAWDDDSAGIPHGVGGFFGDPLLEFNAPEDFDGLGPNEFTLMVFDSYNFYYTNPTFEIHVHGVSACSVPPTVVEIDIDPDPGNESNSINLCNQGNVTLVILSTADFDATTVDPETATLADADVRTAGKSGRLMANIDDVDGDGTLDLVMKFATVDLALTPGVLDTEATVKAETFDGEKIEGTDNIQIVKYCE